MENFFLFATTIFSVIVVISTITATLFFKINKNRKKSSNLVSVELKENRALENVVLKINYLDCKIDNQSLLPLASDKKTQIVELSFLDGVTP